MLRMLNNVMVFEMKLPLFVQQRQQKYDRFINNINWNKIGKGSIYSDDILFKMDGFLWNKCGPFG